MSRYTPSSTHGTAWARDRYYPPDPYLPPRQAQTGAQKGFRPEWDTPDRNDAAWQDRGGMPPAGKYLPKVCPHCGLSFAKCICHPSDRDDWFTYNPATLTPRERERIARGMADRRTWAKDAGAEQEPTWHTKRFPWLTPPWRFAPPPYDAEDARRWDAGRPSQAEEAQAARARAAGRTLPLRHTHVPVGRKAGRPMSRPRRTPYPGCVRLYEPGDASRDARDFFRFYPWGIPERAVPLWQRWAENREALRLEDQEQRLEARRARRIVQGEVTDAERVEVARWREMAACEEVLQSLADWARRLRRDAAKGQADSLAYRVVLGGMLQGIVLPGGEREYERDGVLRRLEEIVAKGVTIDTVQPLSGGGPGVGRARGDRYLGGDDRPPVRQHREPVVGQGYTTWLDVAPFAGEIAPQDLPGWLTVKEAAALAGVSDQVVYNWVKQSGVQRLARGGRGGGYVYRRADVKAWAARRLSQRQGHGRGQGHERRLGPNQGQQTTSGQPPKVVANKYRGSGDAA